MVITGRGTRSMLRAAAGRLTRTDGHGRGALAAFGALAAADLLATAAGPRGSRGPGSPRGLRRAAKPLLMPALAVHALRRDPRAPKPLLAGLACATVGDTALLADRHRPAFLLGMAAFLGTQLSYTAGYLRLGALDGLRRRPLAAAGCLAGWAAVNAALSPALDRQLRLPVAGYSLALTVMGVAALGVGGAVGAGAAAFLGSDLLIGLQQAGLAFPSQETLIMAGYLLGQYLITTGWLDLAAADAATA
ncbi:lysoplasmalogenase [Streptomyces sp. 549]|uniref:lysoplasmalogenase n=1 Tax=Streptomyces sp. 549 TaxID=3049076 RepID=UPI0024C22664|nr:lysoplasmalogenase [Streptomyces sp. 549]MDK1475969.1 lysoplasmalogenase [Streptomyces sp. 549]